MKAKSLIGTLIIISVLANILALFNVNPVDAQTTTLSVNPTQNIHELGQIFILEIWINNVSNLNGWEAKIGYDSSVLEITSITEGSFLRSGGASTYFSIPYYGANYVQIGGFIQTVEWVDGSGIVAKITFKVVSNGNSDLNPYDTKMFDPELIAIDHTTLTGVFYTTYPKAGFFSVPSTLITPIDIPVHLKRDPVAGETITFNATEYKTLQGTYGGSYDPDGSISSYTWNFGDGNITTVTTPIITHFYSTNRSYTMSLNVTDNQGKTDKVIRAINVAKREVAIVNIIVSPQPPKVSPGENVYMNVTVENRGTVYEWINVTAYYDNYPIPYNHPEREEPIAFLNYMEPDPARNNLPPLQFPPGKRLTINFTWTTAGLPEGDYALWANVSIVYQDTKATVNPWKILPNIEQNLIDNIWVYGNVTITPVHNLAVTEFKLSPVLKKPNIVQYGTQTVTANVTVANTGAFNETGFYVTLYRGIILVHNWTDLELQVGKNITLMTTMDLSGLPMGTYTLKANASLVPGEIRTEDNNKTLPLILTLAPVASFTYSPAKPIPNEFIKFNATSSYAAWGWNITGYEWTFKEGQIRTTTEPTYDWSYADMTTYNVTLKVTDSNGLTGTVTKQVPVGTYPKASFNFSPAAPLVEQYLTFDASQSTPNYQQGVGLGTIQSYVWDFGDQNQTTVTTQTIVHRYLKGGNFSVTLTVIDNEGLNDTIIKYVVVARIPSTLTVSVTPSTIVLGQGAVSINGSLTPAQSVTVSLWHNTTTGSWVFIKNVTTDGNGNFQTNWTPTSAATYSIKATWAGNEKYLADESETALTVTPPPVTDLSGVIPYVAGGIMVLVILAAGIYLIRRKKPT